MNTLAGFLIVLLLSIGFEEYRLYALRGNISTLSTDLSTKDNTIKDLREANTVLTVNNRNLKVEIKGYNEAVLTQASEATRALDKYKQLQKDSAKYARVIQVMPKKELDDECENIKAYIDGAVQFVNSRLQ